MLELALPAVPGEQTIADLGRAAHALAYVVIANRRFTDLYAWGQRSVPLSLAAEIQHRLLPGAYTCEAGQCTLSAWLEPAGDVGGDTFDFILDRDLLHLSMTDAMGHDVGVGDPRDGAGGRAAQRAAGGRHARPSRRASAAPRCSTTSATAASSPGSSCGSTCAPRPRPSSTPAIRCRCGCATASSRRSPWRPTRRSAPSPGHAYRTQALAFEPGDRRAVLHRRHRSTTRAGARGPREPPARDRRTCIPARPSRQLVRERPRRQPAGRCATTPPRCASTGTAAGRSRAAATAAPTRPRPRPPSRSASSACSGSPGAT